MGDFGPNHRVHDCENCDGECYSWDGYHGNPVNVEQTRRDQDNVPLAPWERALLDNSQRGMTLEAVTTDGHHALFDNVAIDSARIERGVLVFEGDDTSTRVPVYYVPNVVHWVTFYR